jgi:bifunctional non-homologous end joining protein LigD
MLARPATAFDSPDFLYEIKWDGTRCILFAERKSVRLQNRKLIDVSFKYPEIAAQRDRIKAQTAILDGEIVYLRKGKPDFYMLQKSSPCATRKRFEIIQQGIRPRSLRSICST